MKKHLQKAGSHKEVYILFVGTGVLDCPQRHNCNAEDQRIPPIDFKKSIGGSLFI